MNVRCKTLSRLASYVGWIIVAACLTSCVGGGTIASYHTAEHEILAAYRPEGSQGGTSATYYLIQTNAGLALVEKAPDQHDALITSHWRDTDGDHFAIWVEFLSRQGGAFEYVIPTERDKEARKYFYPAGTYVKVNLNGITRPVPDDRKAHVPVSLVPLKVPKTTIREGE